MRARGLTVILVALSAALAAQSAPTGGSARTWQGRHAEIEEFLRTAPFEKLQEVPIGVTKPMRGYFPDGGLVRSASRMAVVSSDAAESFSKYPEAFRRKASTA